MVNLNLPNIATNRGATKSFSSPERYLQEEEIVKSYEVALKNINDDVWKRFEDNYRTVFSTPLGEKLKENIASVVYKVGDSPLFSVVSELKKIKFVKGSNPQLQEGIAKEVVERILYGDILGNDLGFEEKKELLKEGISLLSFSFSLRFFYDAFEERRKSEEERLNKIIYASQSFIDVLHELNLRKEAQLLSLCFLEFLSEINKDEKRRRIGWEISKWWKENNASLSFYRIKLEEIIKEFLSECEIPVLIEGRNKDAYSIYKKYVSLSTKRGLIRLTVKEIDDVLGIRCVCDSSKVRKLSKALISLNNSEFKLDGSKEHSITFSLKQVNDYYHFGYFLGEKFMDKENVNKLWKSILGEIEVPLNIEKRKSGYRGVHLKFLINIEDKKRSVEVPCEIQITSRNCYSNNEFGIASHINYKNSEVGGIARILRDTVRIGSSYKRKNIRFLFVLEEEGKNLSIDFECFMFPESLDAKFIKANLANSYLGKTVVVDDSLDESFVYGIRGLSKIYSNPLITIFLRKKEERKNVIVCEVVKDKFVASECK